MLIQRLWGPAAISGIALAIACGGDAPATAPTEGAARAGGSASAVQGTPALDPGYEWFSLAGEPPGTPVVIRDRGIVYGNLSGLPTQWRRNMRSHFLGRSQGRLVAANNLGDYVVTRSNSPAPGDSAWLVRNQRETVLPTSGLGLSIAEMNDADVVVGSVLVEGVGQAAFRWSPQTGFQVIGTPVLGNGRSSAAINASGMVVGNVDGLQRPWIWTESGGLRDLVTELGCSEGIEPCGRVASVNDLGHVAGIRSEGCWYDCWGVPFIWSEADGVAQLPITNARVFSINNDGVVAGVRRAEWPRVGVLVWLWSPADGLREIDDCEGANPFIRMNDDGEIVGMKGVGEPWPVVWRPVKQFGK